MAKAPLSFTFYIAAPIEKVWNGFVSKEANRTIFWARISTWTSGRAESCTGRGRARMGSRRGM